MVGSKPAFYGLQMTTLTARTAVHDQLIEQFTLKPGLTLINLGSRLINRPAPEHLLHLWPKKHIVAVNRNIGISRTSAFNYLEEVRVRNLGRYVTLTFAYALSGFGKKQDPGGLQINMRR